MATPFRLEHDFPDIPIDVFERYLNHPELIEMCAAIPAFRSRDLVEEHDDGGGKRRWRFKVVAGGDIPAAARKVLTEEMLTWHEDTRFLPEEHTIYFTIEPIRWKGKFDCRGTWRLEPRGEGTHRVIAGSLAIPLPLVGKVAETVIVGELKKNYEVEADVQRRFYRRMMEREAKG
jgi:hypothetical protein